MHSSDNQNHQFIQLRDNDMRLIDFFNHVKLDEVLEREKLQHLKPKIIEVINKAENGKLNPID